MTRLIRFDLARNREIEAALDDLFMHGDAAALRRLGSPESVERLLSCGAAERRDAILETARILRETLCVTESREIDEEAALVLKQRATAESPIRYAVRGRYTPVAEEVALFVEWG